MTVSIRQAFSSDWLKIVDFQLKMARETEAIELERSKLSKGVKSVFENQELGKYYVAESDGEVIGSFLITYEWSDWRNAMVWWLQSLYIETHYRRKGIFRLIFTFLNEIIQKNDQIAGLRLYVDKTNHIAIKTYEKMGMQAEHYLLFEHMK